MAPTLHIALRFLVAKKRSMLMSLSCTVLGVGLFIVTQATTSGFEEYFIKTILGTDGAIRIQDKIQSTSATIEAGYLSPFRYKQREGKKYIEGIDEPEQVITVLKSFSNVDGTSKVLTGNVTVFSSFKAGGDVARVFGIQLDDHLKVSDLGKQIVAGSLDDFRSAPGSAVLGRELCDRLQLEIDDSFRVESSSETGKESRRYKVAAIFETGVSDIDRVRIYLNMGEARSLFKKPTGASFIQVSLHNPSRAPEDAERMVEVLDYSASSWQERQKTWLGVFRALRISTAITVSVFTLIAGLAMFNTLAMIVMEKTKDIAILRSMGYTREDVTKIFMWQAGIVLAIGTVAGCSLGAFVTWTVEQVPIDIHGIFATKHFIVSWNPWHYVAAVSTAVIMVMIASLIPSRRAARLEPGDIIRGTAQ